MIFNNKINEYNILNKIVAGIVLEGWEVKNIKHFKNIELNNSYIINVKNEIFLKNSKINDIKFCKLKIERNRKLLLKKKEIRIILKKMKKFKILPFNIFIKKNIIKIEIVIVIKKY